MLADLLPVLIAAHVLLALSLVLPGILLPFGLRLRRASSTPIEPGRISRALYRLQRHAALWIGGGLAITGGLLVLAIGEHVLAQPWLLLALVLYAIDLLVALFIQRPALARLLGLRPGSSQADREHWLSWARRQRYVSYLMALLVGVIAMLMMAKPEL